MTRRDFWTRIFIGAFVGAPVLYGLLIAMHVGFNGLSNLARAALLQ
jgi:hypothetical protein